jgi:hypothetical protein
MKMRIQLSLKLALVAALVVTAMGIFAAKTIHRTRDGSVPIVFECTPSNPAPNSTVTYTVRLDSPTSTDEVITIGSTDPLAFTILPAYVVVPAGSDSTTFTAHTSLLFTSWDVLAATANGVTALVVMYPSH